MMAALLVLGTDPSAETERRRGRGGCSRPAAASSTRSGSRWSSVWTSTPIRRGRRSALHIAIRAGEDEIVQFLADHRADFDALDQFGRTPLEEAEFEAPTHTIELMRGLAAERAAGIH